MPIVSVIVPVYNVERYLAACLDSVRRQTLEDIEIICVNDGSTDRSRAILELAQKVEPRLRVVDKPNGGLSSARNAGMRVAAGMYLCFLDSDDFMEPTACEVIAQAFEDTGAEAVTYGANPWPPFDPNPWLVKTLSPRDTVYERFEPDLLFKEESHPYAWRTAITRAFYERTRLEFDEQLAFGEDQLFHFALYPRVAPCALISDKLVYYRVNRAGSLMESRLKDSSIKVPDHLDILEAIYKDWRQGGFIEPYGKELLAWSADFILMDLFRLDDDDRVSCAQRLKGLWTEYFSDEVLEMGRHDSTFGDMTRAVLDEPDKLTGSARVRLTYAALRRMYGVGAALHEGCVSVMRDTPWGWIKTAFKHVFGRSAKTTDTQIFRAQWIAIDEQKLAEALSLLQVEAACVPDAGGEAHE